MHKSRTEVNKICWTKSLNSSKIKMYLFHYFPIINLVNHQSKFKDLILRLAGKIKAVLIQISHQSQEWFYSSSKYRIFAILNTKWPQQVELSWIIHKFIAKGPQIDSRSRKIGLLPRDLFTASPTEWHYNPSKKLKNRSKNSGGRSTIRLHSRKPQFSRNLNLDITKKSKIFSLEDGTIMLNDSQ